MALRKPGFPGATVMLRRDVHGGRATACAKEIGGHTGTWL